MVFQLDFARSAQNPGTNNGTIQALDGSTVQIAGSTITGGTLTTAGSGVISNAGVAAFDGITNTGKLSLNNSGVIQFRDGTITNNNQILLTAGETNAEIHLNHGNVTLAGGGTLTMSSTDAGTAYILADNGAWRLTNDTGHTIQGFGNIGAGQTLLTNNGLINANSNANTLTLQPGTSLTNSGTLRATNGATLLVASGTTTNQAGGVVEALANSPSVNSTVVFGSGATVTNLSSGILTGGIWTASSLGGTSATIDFQGANTFISRNDADIYLIGADSVIQGRNGTLTQSLDTRNSTNGSLWDNRGSLHIQDRTFDARAANGGNFYNRAGSLLELNNATFQSASLTMNANNLADISTINSYGTSTLTTTASQVGNNGIGQVNALSGTLRISKGVNLSSTLSTPSSMTTYAGATIDLSDATAASTIGILNNNGNLNLGAQNINVSADYTNANFGVGNSFNSHASVSGTGQILATGNVGISLTGTGITGGTTATPTLALGNVHVGATNNGSFNINNTGSTGPVIRGAIQTTGIPGLGLTAQNFGPIALGGLATVDYSYTPGTAGALSGQTFNVVTNFDNVTAKTVTVTGTAYNLAAASVTPSPVTLANQRVGGSLAQALTVANTAPVNATYTETLAASFGTNTGSATPNPVAPVDATVGKSSPVWRSPSGRNSQGTIITGTGRFTNRKRGVT